MIQLWKVLPYDAETWVLKQKYRNKILVTIDYLRNLAWISRLYKIRSSITRREDITVKRSLNWIRLGRKKRGKPKPTWGDGMLASMGKRDMPEEDMIDICGFTGKSYK